MSVYFQYRVARSKLTSIERVCVLKTSPGWIFRDIKAEIEDIFPDVHVFESSWHSSPGGRCDLAISPYEGEAFDSRLILRSIRWAAALPASHLMFVDVTFRTIEIVPVSGRWRFFFSRLFERSARSLRNPRKIASRIFRRFIRGSLPVGRTRDTAETR